MLEQIKKINNLEDLQKLYSDTFGKNGTLTERLKNMKSLSDSERAALNKEKEELQQAFKVRQEDIENETMIAALSLQKLDATAKAPLPVDTDFSGGTIHPLTRALAEISAILTSMGYSMRDGPEIEDDWHNFTALNTPQYHPARDMQDTFFTENENILRTQTSSVQIRSMEKEGAPIKIFCPGTTFRQDMDATHSPMFHQVEGLVVDKDITLQDLVSDLKNFYALFFETNEIELRIRPSYFPFTEPSIEYDIEWDKSIGRPKKGSGVWMEMGGAGMVHPQVLRNCNVDPDKFQGFAFGFGLDRVTMLKYGLNDIRKFYDGDVRWLKNN